MEVAQSTVIFKGNTMINHDQPIYLRGTPFWDQAKIQMSQNSKEI